MNKWQLFAEQMKKDNKNNHSIFKEIPVWDLIENSIGYLLIFSILALVWAITIILLN